MALPDGPGIDVRNPQSVETLSDRLLIELDQGGFISGWSDSVHTLLGYLPGEIAGCTANDLFEGLPDIPPSREPVPDAWEWHGKVTVRNHEGHLLPMELTATRLHGREARWLLVGGTVGGSGPVSAAGDPNTVQLLIQAHQRGPFATVIHDADLRFVLVSDEFRRLMHLPADDQLLGRRLREVLGNSFYDEVESRMLRVLASGEAIQHVVRPILPGQTTDRAWTIHISPLKDGQGQALGVYVTAVEATERYWARRWLAMLSEAGTRVGTSLDVSKTAAELTEMIVPRFADIAMVDLLDSVFHGDEPARPEPTDGAVALRRVANKAHPSAIRMGVEVGEAQSYPGYSPPARCIATGRGLLTGQDDPGFVQWVEQNPRRTAGLHRYGLRSMVAVPLQARGKILGVLMCCRSRTAGFTESHLRVAEELAARAALSLDNARRYTRERTTAIALQRSLLPHKPPKQSALDIATRYLPTDRRIGVGGDWFDVIPLSGARVAMVVGDVVGHGMHASGTMARLRGAVRTLADVDMPPDEVLTHLDDVVTQLSIETGDEAGDEQGMGATCLYAVYDPILRRCSLAAAGHPPPAVVLPDGSASILQLPIGPPLGVGGLAFELTEVDVPEGSTLVLFTDGLIESRTHDADDRLAELCRAVTVRATSVETLCDLVLKEMLSGPPADDVALLVARTRALDPSQVATWMVPTDPAAVAGTRENALRQLSDWGLEDLAFSTELIVSELVTNAIRYGRQPIRLRLIRDETLICEVSDSGATAPHLRRAHVFDEGGRGLLLVAHLSRRWGSRHTEAGKTIWCEQACPTPRPVHTV